MAKIDVTRTELVWPGKYNEDGTRREVERVQTESVAPYAEARDSIRDKLFQEKFEAKRKEWLAGVRSRAFIQVLMQPGDLQAQSAKP